MRVLGAVMSIVLVAVGMTLMSGSAHLGAAVPPDEAQHVMGSACWTRASRSMTICDSSTCGTSLIGSKIETESGFAVKQVEETCGDGTCSEEVDTKDKSSSECAGGA
jgi:hypothetical protein